MFTFLLIDAVGETDIAELHAGIVPMKLIEIQRPSLPAQPQFIHPFPPAFNDPLLPSCRYSTHGVDGDTATITACITTVHSRRIEGGGMSNLLQLEVASSKSLLQVPGL